MQGAGEERRWWAETAAAEDEEKRRESERRVARLAYLASYPFPTGAELLDKLRAGESQELDGHKLNYEVEHGIWVTNPYGIDCMLLEPTAEDCQSFVDAIRADCEFGPIP
jgi:hypothetical protein